MEENLNLVLAQLVEKVVGGVDAAVEFSKQEIPEVLAQLLIWRFSEAMVWFAICSTLLFTYLHFAYKDLLATLEGGSSTFSRDIDGDPKPEALFHLIPGVFLIAPCAIGTIANLLEMVKILVAPKLYLLEYGVSLIK